jgi:nicotinamide phosphoribosyltransferase
LRAAEKTFGVTVNTKGYKVTKGVGVIQGDGISSAVIADILRHALAEGYSAQNIAFGMGGGLLQKVNRDSLSMAVKLCHITYADGKSVDVMKFPVNDTSKTSLPGEVAVTLVDGIPTVFPATSVDPQDNLLHVVYDKKPIQHTWPDFDTVKQRVAAEWDAMPRAPHTLSVEMEEKQKRVRERLLHE